MSHVRPTQRERVLALLKAAGARGVRTNEFLDQRLPRFGARIYELRQRGYLITASPDKHSKSGNVYVLALEWPSVPRDSRTPKKRATLSSFLTREQQWALLNACDEVIALAPPGSMPRRSLIEARQIVRKEIGSTAIPMDDRDKAVERYSQ